MPFDILELMDFLLIFASLFSIIILYLSCFLHAIITNKFSKLSLPPGKMGLPLLGESVDFISSVQDCQIERFVIDRVSRCSSCIFKTSLLGDPVVVIHGPIAKNFISNDNKVVEASWPKNIQKLIPSTVAKSFTTRDLLHPFLKPRILQKSVKLMDSITQRHLESKWEGQKKVSAYPLVQLYTFALECQLFLSVADEELDKLMASVNTLTKGFVSVPINIPCTKFSRAMKAKSQLLNQLRLIVSRRKAVMLSSSSEKHTSTCDEDLLSHMLQSVDEMGKNMTEAEIADRALGFLIAAYDSPSIVICLTLSYLADHPEIYYLVFQEQTKVAANKEPGELLSLEDINEMKYSWNVVCEVMRLHPPTPFLFRKVTSNFTYDGFHIPKGWKIWLGIQSTHKDPRYFPEPETFNPSRFKGDGPPSNTYMPFGRGSWMCPGKKFAQLEILVFIHNLVKRFRWEKLIPEEKIILGQGPAQGLPILLHPQ